MASTAESSSLSGTDNKTPQKPSKPDQSKEIDKDNVDGRKTDEGKEKATQLSPSETSSTHEPDTKDEEKEPKAKEDGGEGSKGEERGKGAENAGERGGDGYEGGEESKEKFEGIPKEGPLRDKRQICKHSRVIVILVVFAIPIILAGLSLLFYYKEDFKTPQDLVREFSHSFDQLKASFPRQTPRFWRIVRNRAAAHLKNPNPMKPLVFMLTAGPSAHGVLECIARKLAQSLDYEDNGIGYVNSSDYHQHSSLDNAKQILDETLKQMLEKGRVVLVSNVDQLPVQSPLLFYEYCDNENAPYTHASIIFTVRLPSEPDSTLEPAKADGLVTKYLRETWGKQDYRPDDIPPLVSRITDTVAMVMEENKETVEKNCAI